MTKKFSKFYTFWMSLPVGATRHLKNTFPQMGIFKSVSEHDSVINERIFKLNEWFRELCLDEKCMSNSKVLKSLDALFSSASATSLSPQSGQVDPGNLHQWVVIPENEIKSLPGIVSTPWTSPLHALTL